MTNAFRFAVQATPRDGDQWLATARRAEELGYSALLMPDGTQLLSPLPALALVAGATTSLHVGTWVLASPLRPPRLAAWDAHTLSALTGGRFEMGIGTGRPEVEEQSVRLLGRPAPDGRDEVARLVNEIRQTAADRTERIEFASPLFVVGDEAPPWVQRFLDADMAELTARDSLQILRGTPRQMADELQRRRDTVGTSYV